MLRRYVHGPSTGSGGVDEPLVWYEGPGTASRRFLQGDERGSVIALSDAAGASLAINRYDEYGLAQAGNLGRLGYTGQAALAEVSLIYYKARMYSPALGRFLQTDPIGYGDGLNWYDYVGGDPVNFVDPSGLLADVCKIGEICVVGPTRDSCSWSDGCSTGYRLGDIIGIVPFDRSDLEVNYGVEIVVNGRRPPRLKPGPAPIVVVPQSNKPSTLEKLGQCASDQLGLGELAEAAAVAAGQPIPGTKPFVTPGSSRGTSAAGMAADSLLGKTRLPVRLPTVVGGPGTGRALAIAGTKSAARFAGRAVPIVGWALLAYDAASIAICTASGE